MKTIRLEGKLKFNPGDKVWTITPRGEVRDTSIRWINSRLGIINGVQICYPISYECGTLNEFNEGVFDCSFLEYELYKSKRTAQRNAKFIPVNFSEDDWYAAIGLKDEIKRSKYNEDCDLTPCCAYTSDIRDALNMVRQYKGFTSRQKQELQALLNGHDAVENKKSKIV